MKKKLRISSKAVWWSLISLAAVAVVLAVALGVPFYRTARTSAAPTAEVTPRTVTEVKVKEVEKIVEIKQEISAEMLQEGLNDIGFLLTEEYYFTEVVSFSSIKTLFNFLELGITESKFLASYDGVISAGIDFAGIRVEKNDEARLISVYVPLPEIRSVDIDPNSFELYSEKEGLGNPISIADYNQSLITLEENATQKAVDHGLLERAAENAQLVIRNFILSMFDEEGYTLRLMPAGN